MPNPAFVQTLPAWLSQCAAGLRTLRAAKTVVLGQNWAITLPGATLGNVLLPPNRRYPNCETNGKNSLAAPGVFSLSSFHPGGSNVLLADGSVRFLKDNVNQQTLWSLGSRNQGEVISSDAF